MRSWVQNIKVEVIFTIIDLFLTLSWPNAEEYVAVGENSDVYIVHQDGVKVSGLFIAKKCVRLPHLLRVSQGEVFQPAYNREDFIQ